jgi:mannose-6-phosphate isomerase-like protein (cupin superfamily)
MTTATDTFNVLHGTYRPVVIEAFGHTPADVQVLHVSGDRRQFVAACRYPHGASVTSVGDAAAQEVFYVVAGAGSRRFDDGRVAYMAPGDLIYVRPGQRVHYAYDPGFTIVVHFWAPAPAELPSDLFAALGEPLI